MTNVTKSFAWFDRVASASDPVDALSRGCVGGPWQEVEVLQIPMVLEERMRKEIL